MALVKVQTGPQILCDYTVSDVTNKIYFSAIRGISFTGFWNAGASHAEPLRRRISLWLVMTNSPFGIICCQFEALSCWETIQLVLGRP